MSAHDFVVGIINVSDTKSVVIESEFRDCLPSNVRIIFRYAPLQTVSYDGLMKFLDALPQALGEMIDENPDVVVIPSMTGSAIKGYEIVNMLEQRYGVPVIVPALEIKKYLKKIRKTNIAIVSAFGVELNLLEQLFFKNHDIEVVNLINLFDTASEERLRVELIDADLVLDKVRSANFDKAEAVLFDSPTYQLKLIMQELKKYIHVPILSVNEVLIYSTLKKLGLSTEHLSLEKSTDDF